jgi:hypothetical protein
LGCRWEREGAQSTIWGKTERVKDVLPTNEKENPMTTTSLTPDTNELQEISGLPTESALQRAATFLARLVEDPAFVESEILPLLEEARHREGW